MTVAGLAIGSSESSTYMGSKTIRLAALCLATIFFATAFSSESPAKPKTRFLTLNGLRFEYPSFLTAKEPAVHKETVALLVDAKSDGGLFIVAPSHQYSTAQLIEEARAAVVSMLAPSDPAAFSWKNTPMLYAAGTEAGLKRGNQRLSAYDIDRVRLRGFNGSITLSFEYHLLRMSKRAVLAGYYFVAARGDTAQSSYEGDEPEEPLQLLTACANTIASITGEMKTKVGRGKDGVVAFDTEGSGNKTIQFSELLRLFSDGPDYVADMIVAMNGAVVTERVARLGGMVRWELAPLQASSTRSAEKPGNDLKVVTIMRPGEHALVLETEGRLYAEVPESQTNNLKPPHVDPVAMLKNAGGFTSKMIIEDAGLVEIDGHQASKVRLRFLEEPGELFFYFAKDLKNLFIKMEGGDKTINGSILLSNISLDVPDDLFRVPADYKKTDFYSLVETVGKKIRP